MKKILAPTDFSPCSQAATHVAVRLAKETDAELVIAHAWYVPALAFGTEPYSFSADMIQVMSDEAKRGLDSAVADATRQGVRSLSGVMLSGTPPWSRLVDVAEADPAFDLIVMGTHGRTGLKRVVLGSVAEKLVRHAPCSVLAVRGEPRPTGFTDVLCPIDFSASSRLAIDRAAELVRPGGSGVTLLHVVEVPVAQSGESFEASFLRDLDKAATFALDEMAVALRARVAVPVTTRVRLGYAGSQILGVLDSDPTFDLVVMGSHGRTGLRRALLGSVAEKTVRHAPCPVMIARDRTA